VSTVSKKSIGKKTYSRDGLFRGLIVCQVHLVTSTSSKLVWPHLVSLKDDGTDRKDGKTINDTVMWSHFTGTGWWDRRDVASLRHVQHVQLLCNSCSVRRMWAVKWTFVLVCLILLFAFVHFLGNQT